MNTLGMIAIVIDEYDLAIAHYVNDLGFKLIEDKDKENDYTCQAPMKVLGGQRR